jgi:hypothetical protein
LACPPTSAVTSFAANHFVAWTSPLPSPFTCSFPFPFMYWLVATGMVADLNKPVVEKDTEDRGRALVVIIFLSEVDKIGRISGEDERDR